MSSKNKQNWLVPGAHGWELWVNGQCQKTFEVRRPGEIASSLSSPLVVVFPVTEATALPFVAPTGDLELIDELTEMHFERVGVMPDLSAGKLEDHFILQRGEDSTKVLGVVLRVQSEQDLPKKSADFFELSPRMYQPEGTQVGIWREFGAWVFSVYDGGQPLYFQALPKGEGVKSLARELKLCLSQLSLQGLLEDEPRFVLWDEDREEAVQLTRWLGKSVEVEARPVPQTPERWSKLLPADIAAERRVAQQRARNLLIGGLATILLLAMIAFFGREIYNDRNQLVELEEKISKLEPEVQVIEKLSSKRSELQQMIDQSMWPQQLLLECASALPAGQVVRFMEFSVSNNDIGQQVVIKGQARDFESVGNFQTLLERNRKLRERFQFRTPSPVQQNDFWVFDWTLEPPREDGE